MTARQIAALAVRILALYSVLLSFPHFQSCLAIATYALGWSQLYDNSPLQRYDFWSVVVAAIVPSAYIGFALLLWIAAEGIAFFMVKEDDAHPLRINARSLHIIAFNCIGLISLVISLPVIVQLIYDVLHAQVDHSIRVWTDLTALNIFTAITQFVFGTFLFFGGRGLVNLVRSVRELGRDPIPESRPE